VLPFWHQEGTGIVPIILSETNIAVRKIQIISIISSFATVFAVVWYRIMGNAPGYFQREIIIDWPDSHRSNENKMVKVDKNTAFSEAITCGNSSRENNKRTGF
jgi:hypothetical protein